MRLPFDLHTHAMAHMYPHLHTVTHQEEREEGEEEEVGEEEEGRELQLAPSPTCQFPNNHSEAKY